MNIPRKLLTAACMLLATHVLAQPYTISPDGTEVTDMKTGLIWRRCSEGQIWNGTICSGTALSHQQAQALALAQTQTGWRLPDVKELSSIVDRSRVNPAIDLTAFPGTFNSLYWSSTPTTTSVNGSTASWAVQFPDGSLITPSRNSTLFVRLVR